MRIGIIGSGNIGATLGRLWAAAGHEVLFSYSRDAAKLRALAESLGPMGTTGSPSEAAAHGEVVVLSVPWPQVDDALAAAGASTGSLRGRVLIDTTNPYSSPGGPLALDLQQTSAAAVVAGTAPGARVVKAFNTLYYVTLAEQAGRSGQQLAMPISGDDPEAKDLVAGLVRDAGYEPVDLGGMDQTRRQEPDGPLYGQELTGDQVRAVLAEPAR